MLEVEPTGQHGRTATGSNRNGNEAVAGAASEAFARWLHHRYAQKNCDTMFIIVVSQYTDLIHVQYIDFHKIPALKLLWFYEWEGLVAVWWPSWQIENNVVNMAESTTYPQTSYIKYIFIISRVALYQVSISGLCDGPSGNLSVRLSVGWSVCLQSVLWQNS